jgi:hypothetical protein
MDFNTGSGSGRPEDESRPLFGGETGGRAPGDPPRGPVGGTGPEFTRSDPVVSFIRAARRVILDPVGFFRSIRRQGDFINPAIFAVICALISALLGGILGLIFAPLFAGSGDTGEAFTGSIGGFIANLVLTPIYAVIGLVIGSGILHLLVLLFVRPANAGFEATFRAVSYSWVYQLISWIPIIGWLVGPIYGIVLLILGIREVHTTTTGTAALIVLIPVAVVLLLVLALIALIGAAIFVGTQQQL